MKKETRCESVMYAGKQSAMEKRTTYMVAGKRFVVTPVFNDNGNDSFGSILMRLMTAEVTAVHK